MRFPGFIGPTYNLESVNVDCQRCINLFPQITESGAGASGEVTSLVSTPGLQTVADLGANPNRGFWSASNGRLFVVVGDKLYELDSAFTATVRATLTTASGPVSMADSGRYLVIVDGSVSGFLLKFGDNVVTPVPFPTEINFVPFRGCNQVSYQDGYFIYNHKDTEQFFISGLLNSTVADESTIDILDFSSADGNPDPLIGHISNQRDLWMFNEKSTEVYYNAGSDFPFQRVQGAFIEVGLAARFSVTKTSEGVTWLGRNKDGSGTVCLASGYAPKRISNHAVEQAISSYADVDKAVAYTYHEDGHTFYVLNFPTAKTTWAYDYGTGLWHERSFNNQGQRDRHRGAFHVFAFGKHLLGDFETGKIYQMSRQIFTDAGTEIIRCRISPHITASAKRVFYSSFQLDVETGVGLDGEGMGTDPKVILQFSDDGGHSWSNDKFGSLGKIGQTKIRAKFQRLGSARDRVFKISISDPVKVTLLGAEIEMTSGAS